MEAEPWTGRSRGSSSRRRRSPSARPSWSRRYPRARSPARRTATRTPTCRTSTPTSTAPGSCSSCSPRPSRPRTPPRCPASQAGSRPSTGAWPLRQRRRDLPPLHRTGRRVPFLGRHQPGAGPGSWSGCRSWPTTASTRPRATGPAPGPVGRPARHAAPRPAPADAPDQGQPGAALDAGRLQPQPARLQGRHGQPRRRRQAADGRAGLGRARRRRARLGGGRQLPGSPHHPDVRRVLGPHPPERAAEDHRPRQGRRGPARPGPRARRPRLRRGPGRPPGPPGTPTSAWPTRAPPRPPAAASCAAASTSRAASTPPGGSTGAWPSSATRRA